MDIENIYGFLLLLNASISLQLSQNKTRDELAILSVLFSNIGNNLALLVLLTPRFDHDDNARDSNK